MPTNNVTDATVALKLKPKVVVISSDAEQLNDLREKYAGLGCQVLTVFFSVTPDQFLHLMR